MEIEANNLETAIQILSDGLQNYPDYPVVYFLLGKALSLTGKYPQALEVFEHGSKLIDSPESLAYLTKQMEEIKKMRSPFGMKKSPTVVVEKFPSMDDDETTSGTETEWLPSGFDNSLSELADRISNAKIQINEPETEAEQNSYFPEPETPAIVSETLAKIYISQGKFAEAIKIYEILLERNPARGHEILRIIEDLKHSTQH